MDNELRYFLEISEKAVNDVTYRVENWTRFLETAARMYKYSFPEQLMIYAQKPDSIAVADISIWEDKFKRWARPGSTGIALLDDTDGYAGLKFVFDVSDTESSLLNARPVQLWEMRDEHINAVLASLAESYGDIDDLPLYEAFRSLAKQIAIEYYNDNAHSLSYRAENSLLAPDIAYDFAGTPIEDAANTELETAFKNALSISIAYSLMSRCGLNAAEYFDEDDLRYISDFNTPEMVYALGTATSELSEQVLRDIERTIKKYDLTHTTERSKLNEREYDRNPYLQGTGRLPAAQYPVVGTAEGFNTAAREIRANEEGFSKETSDYRVQSPVIDRATVLTSAGYGRGGYEARGVDYETADGTNGSAGQGDRSARMGSRDEPLESASGGNDSARIDLQLDSETTDSAASLSLLETSSLFNQIAKSAISLYDVESIFRDGGNSENSTLRIAAHFSKELSDGAEISRSNDAEYLKNEYLGDTASQSKGFDFDGKKVAVLYDDNGVTFSVVDTNDSVQITWEQAAEVIEQLVNEGKYVSVDVLADALENEKFEIADIVVVPSADGFEVARSAVRLGRGYGFGAKRPFEAAEAARHQLPQILREVVDFTLPVRDIPDVYFSTKEFVIVVVAVATAFEKERSGVRLERQNYRFRREALISKPRARGTTTSYASRS
jgi:hypothetical protein